MSNLALDFKLNFHMLPCQTAAVYFSGVISREQGKYFDGNTQEILLGQKRLKHILSPEKQGNIGKLLKQMPLYLYGI